MTWAIAVPMILCFAVALRDHLRSRRLGRWPYLPRPPAPEVDEFTMQERAAEREGAALAELLRRRDLPH